MDIFRYAIFKNEISLRVFHLTMVVISQNSGNYTAWYNYPYIRHIRRKCLDQLPELKNRLLDEIAYLNEIASSMSKNFQYWHHRRLVIDKYGKLPDDELEKLEIAYQSDEKNYHMWTYKMWLTERFNIWDEEKKNIIGKMKENPHNNSAWSYRHYLYFYHGDYMDLSKNEVDFAIKEIISDIDNECAWVYYKGLLFTESKRTSADKKLVMELTRKLKENAKKFCKEIIMVNETNRFALSMLFDILKEEKESMDEAKKICEKLIEVDKIRKN